MSRTAIFMAASGAGTLTAVAIVVAVLVADTERDSGETTPASVSSSYSPPVVVELRVWQHVDWLADIRISARLQGGSSDALEMVRLADLGRPVGYSDGYAEISRHRYGDVVIGGVTLRVWQRMSEPESIFVQACCSATHLRRSYPPYQLWRPLGMTPLLLDEGYSDDGRFRYGDLTVAIPGSYPGLLLDREHLLALRDILEGGATELDWSVGRPTQDWEGVTVSGSPPRVTGLDLADRGLAGEIWGYLGDLEELTKLHLDGNALTGRIPSKVSLLSNLTEVYVGGNDFTGCIPPPLRRAPEPRPRFARPTRLPTT